MITTLQHQLLPCKNGLIACIHLNRPKALNALSFAMIRELRRLLALWQQDPSIKMVIIRGHGDHFCAGGDIREIHQLRQKNFAAAMAMAYQEYQLAYQIYCYPKPYLALIHGITMGGGVGISLQGSHVVAADDLRLAMPETRIGFFPDVGISYNLARCPGKIGLYLALTGCTISQADTLFLKWADAGLPRQAFEQLIHYFQNQSLSGDKAQITALLKRYPFPPSQQEAALPQALSAINHYFSLPNLHSIHQALAQSPSPWAQQTINQLNQCSPLSLLVVFQQWQLSKNSSMLACIERDCTLAYHFLHHPDFYEGVRATLIDKDHDPQWQHATLTPELDPIVKTYFHASHTISKNDL